jgi:hypothetical protein
VQLWGLSVNVPGHPHVIVLPQLRNALIECIRDEPTTIRYRYTTDAHRANLANSAASPSLFERSLAVISVVLTVIDVAVQVKSGRGGQT